MSLLDHFHAPLLIDRPWEGFLSAWATVIVQQLNAGTLPANYVAIPNIHRGTSVEVDVATMKLHESESSPSSVETWQPAAPALTLPVEWSGRDVFEVRVVTNDDAPRLVASIELVSPANKDRPASRQTFAGKCAGYLRTGVSVIIVDVVTTRHENLHRELLALLELDSAVSTAADADIYAVAYRTRDVDSENRLEIWPEALQIGARLPMMPLWIDADRSIPLDLEDSYLATCRSLRIK